jgi:microcystin-dependent protein
MPYAVGNAKPVLPVGTVLDWPVVLASDKKPDSGEWKECDGATLDKTVYADLFALIGYGFGGSGNNFNLPNCKRRVTVGRDPAGGGMGMACQGGEECHALSVCEMPSHCHCLGYCTATVQCGTGSYCSLVCGFSSPSLYAYTGSAGGGLAHNNLQPYLALCKVIKVKAA